MSGASVQGAKQGKKDAEKGKRKFTFPTAFTILFILLILTALATWLIPAGAYALDADGAPIPCTYHQVPANPQQLLVSALVRANPSDKSPCPSIRRSLQRSIGWTAWVGRCRRSPSSATST